MRDVQTATARRDARRRRRARTQHALATPAYGAIDIEFKMRKPFVMLQVIARDT